MLALVASLARVEDKAERSVGEARQVASRVIAQIAGELASRRQELTRAQEALRQCQASKRSSCTAEHAQVRRAETRVQVAQAALDAAQATQQDMNARLGTRAARISRQVSQGRQFLGVRLQELANYTALGSAGVTSSGRRSAAPGSASASAGAGLRHPAGLPAGFAMVPLSLIDQSSNAVTGSQDFGKGYSPQDLAWALQAFNDVVLPGLAAGATADTFRQRDAAARFQGTHSYSMTHSQFLSAGDAICLNRLPDGRYSIANGQHRIWVAGQYGFTHVPAWIP
jgi:hypothetical protein